MVRTSPQQTTELKTLLPPIPDSIRTLGTKNLRRLLNRLSGGLYFHHKGVPQREDNDVHASRLAEETIEQVAGYHISYILEA